jgi:hypothetical protein
MRLVPALAPDWSPASGDFGLALLEIAARLGEETTQRLDRTAERDAIAFFDVLDLPPSPPRAATGMMVFALTESQPRAVFALARTQLSATNTAGDQVTFESGRTLRVAPGRIAEVIAVDPASDRIELAPDPVTSLEAPAALPDRYEVVTFAGAGTALLQISPAVGLAPGDMLRIGASAHSVAEVDDGLVSLRETLDAPVAAGEVVDRVAALEAFDLRDLQRHVFHIGHAELLNLEQPAIISLDLAPPDLARELTRLDVAYSAYGTVEGADEGEWHPLELLGSNGSAIRLAKTWIGTVDELKLDGEKSRWVRAELQSSVTGASGPLDRVSRICLDVASLQDERGTQSGTGGTGGSAPGGLVEGSRTIVSAFHNGTPLSTASRFYPLGPEPLRFDTFALAAPEALSKRGARATIAIDLADSSLVGFEVAAQPPRSTAPVSNGAMLAAGASSAAEDAANGYGVGRNGYLQVARFSADGSFRWYELEPRLDSGQPILLGAGGVAAAATLGSSSNTDLVVVPDRDGGLVAAKIGPSGDGLAAPMVGGDGWVALPGISGQRPGPADAGGPGERGAAPVGMSGLLPASDEIVVFDVLDGVPHSMRVGDNLSTVNPTWLPLSAGGDAQPVLTDRWLLTPVLSADWPRREPGDQPRFVLVDSRGDVWLGELAFADGTPALTVTWYRMSGPAAVIGDGGQAPQAALDVTPSATRFRNGDGDAVLWVAYARPVEGDDSGAQTAGDPVHRVLHGLLIDAMGGFEQVTLDDEPGNRLAPRSALHANPRVPGRGHRQPVTVGIGPAHNEVVAWLGADEVTRTPTTEPVSIGRPLLLEIGPDPGSQVVLPATGERLLRLPLVPEMVDYHLHDSVSLESKETPHWVEIATDPDDASTSVVLSLDAKRLMSGNLRVFQIDHPDLQVEQSLRFVRRVGPDRPPHTGLVDPNDRTKVELDGGDRYTRTRRRLLIADATYLIEDIDDSVATLDRPVLGSATEIGYLTVLTLGERPVRSTDLHTLAELTIDGGSPPPDELRFVGGASPTTQQLGLQGRSGGSLWAQLTVAWITPPATQGPAIIPGALVPSAWTVEVFARGYQNPELSWEYYDGEGWRRLQDDFIDGTNDLSTSGSVSFLVPGDLAVSEIGGKDDYWIRARLIGGDYGRPSYVVDTRQLVPPAITEQVVVIDSTALRPPEILSIETSFKLQELAPAEIVLVENNLAVSNQTQAATAQGARFDLFRGAAAIDPDAPERAVYIGLSAPPGTGELRLLVDADDQPGGGPVRADLRTPEGWRPLTVDDRTSSLRRRGTLSIPLDLEPVLVRLFARDRVWIRLRPEASGGGSWAPVVRGLRLNAVEIAHARTVEDEILGSSLGQPGLQVELSEQPVLPDTVVLRVREQLGTEERAALEADYEADTARPAGPSSGPQDDPEPAVVSGVERLPGCWVLWRRVDSLVGQSAEARVYLLDPGTGAITFGDGRNGKVPPAGRDGIRAFRYQQGGGEAGNVPAWTEAKLISSVEGVETVILPGETAGGFSGGRSDDLFLTAPDRLRHAGQAMTPVDIEAIAIAASPDIVQAHCAPPDGPGRPVQVAIATRGSSRCPQPSLAVRDAVAALIRQRGWGGLDADLVDVVGPEYVRASVTVRLIAPVDRLAEVERLAEKGLVDLLHPVEGGPGGRGWPFGRAPTVSDVIRALAGVDGLDRVDTVDLTTVGPRSLDRLPANGLVCVEATDITVVVEPPEDRP